MVMSVCFLQIFYLEHNDGHFTAQHAMGTWKGMQSVSGVLLAVLTAARQFMMLHKMALFIRKLCS